MEIRVYYEDTDCGGVVYYANYLRWLERGRTEFLRARGVELGPLMEQDIWLVVSECNIKYRSPARYGDLLAVTTDVDELGAAAFWLKNRVLRGGEPLAEARVRIACISGPTGRPLRLPEQLALALGGNGPG